MLRGREKALFYAALTAIAASFVTFWMLTNPGFAFGLAFALLAVTLIPLWWTSANRRMEEGLRVVAGKPTRVEALEALTASGLSAEMAGAVLEGMERNGWMMEHAGRLMLTSQGRFENASLLLKDRDA